MGKLIKTIHYCWFGGNKLPENAIKCINSWKKYCPNFEIKEWNEKNFDIHSCKYVEQAYDSKKWAFVSDYARFWILYNHGGVYFDTDVELIKPIDSIVENGPFMGYEAFCPIEFLNPKKEYLIAPGLGLGADKHMTFYKEILEQYEADSFIKDDGSFNTTTVVDRVSKILLYNNIILDGKLSKQRGITLYPEDYFCPLNYANGKMKITCNTISIHHYDSTWISSKDKLKMSIRRMLPAKVVSFILSTKSRLRK